jgi:hypothetical protein
VDDSINVYIRLEVWNTGIYGRSYEVLFLGVVHGPPLQYLVFRIWEIAANDSVLDYLGYAFGKCACSLMFRLEFSNSGDRHLYVCDRKVRGNDAVCLFTNVEKKLCCAHTVDVGNIFYLAYVLRDGRALSLLDMRVNVALFKRAIIVVVGSLILKSLLRSESFF